MPKKKVKATKPEKLSLKGYAEHRGVAPAAIRRALTEGRIPAAVAVKGDTGRWTIDVAAADAAMDANTRRPKKNPSRVKDTAAAHPELAERELRFGRDQIPVDENGDPLPPVMVQAIKTAVDAQLRQLELEQFRGSLVTADDVERRFRHVGQLVRDKILSVPSRLASKLARLTDETACEIALEEALTEALLALVQAQAGEAAV